jgi:hypothetical protein
MRGFLQRLVERLHDGERPLSRNKHFHVFTGGAAAALRVDRHLRDLEAQLAKLQARGERPRVRRLSGGRVQLVLRDARLSVVRTATLSPEDAALLARHPAGAWALQDEESQAEGGGASEQAAASGSSGSRE